MGYRGKGQNSPLGVLGRGLAAAGVGTAAMDAVLYTRYRRDGGEQGWWAWETGAELRQWDDASTPGLVGKRVLEALLHRKLPNQWARPTNNTVHWLTGLAWGAQMGVVALSSAKPRVWWGPLLGSAAWLTSYAVLPNVGLYKPMGEYDFATLAKDLSAHIVYGTVTGAVFVAVT